MNPWKEPSPSDWGRWEAMLAEGMDPSEAAHATGCTSSRFRRGDGVRHAALIAMSRRVREERRRAAWGKKKGVAA